MTFTEAFAKYGATLRNPQWSMSALAIDGSLVVSLYANWFQKGDRPRTLTYTDRLFAWKVTRLAGMNFDDCFRVPKRKVPQFGSSLHILILVGLISWGKFRTNARSRRRSLFGKTGRAPLNTLMATNIASWCVRSSPTYRCEFTELLLSARRRAAWLWSDLIRLDERKSL